MESEEIDKLPWPALPAEQYTSIESGPWGYLLIFADKPPEFLSDERPSDEEIVENWGYLLDKSHPLNRSL